MIDKDAEAAYRNRVKANYGFSDWANQTKEGTGDVRLTDLLLAPEEFNGWKLEEKEDSPPSARQRRVVRYIFSSSREGERLVSTIYECNTVRDAHEALIDVVMTYMAPKLPRCETKGLEIGDVCFGSHSDMSLSVIFARFNMLAEIKSVGSEPTSVDEFARNVDSLVLQSIRKNDEQVG